MVKLAKEYTMQNYNPVTQDLPNDTSYPASMVPVYFTSKGSKLLGTMFIATGEGPHPAIILMHGFPGNEVNYDLAHSFRRQGFNVLVFHYRGCWGSEGEYSWKNMTEDVNPAIEFVKSDFAKTDLRCDADKIILAGYSMGGFAALYNSIFHDEIKNVISIAGFNSGAFGQFLDGNKMIFDYSVQKMLPAIPFVKNDKAENLLNELIENKKEWNLINHAEKLSAKNLLMIAAKHDTTAPLEIHHNPLTDKLKSVNAKMENYLMETGHSFSDKRIELAEIISRWLSKIEL